MSDIGTYYTEKYGEIDIAYVPTGKNCGHWIAKKSETGKFLGSADNYNELIRDIEGHGG